MSKKQAETFIERLREDAGLRNALAALDEGDWAGVVKIGRDAGLRFTASEIQALVPPGFYKGAGKNPTLGWSPEHRPEA